MRQIKLLFTLLLILLTVSIRTLAQGVGTTFTVGDIKYRISVSDLTPSHAGNAVEIMQVSGSGTITVPPTVIHPQNHETYKVTSTYGWMEASPATVTKIVLPEGLTRIAQGSFTNCTGLAEVQIPSTCTEIANGCFTQSDNLKRFTVVNSNNAYQSNADGWLLNKSGNKLVYLPKGWDQDVNIPASITSIGQSGMFRCMKTKVVRIPATFTNIDESTDYPAFTGSATKYEVNSGNSVFKDIDGVLFNKTGTELIAFPVNYYNKPAIDNNPLDPIHKYIVPESTTTIKSNAFLGTFDHPKTLDLKNVVTLEDKALSQMWGLVDIKISASVTSIGKGMFTGCANLAAINVDNSNAKYKDDHGVLYTKDGLHIMQFPPKKAGNYAILDGTKYVDEEAFRATPNQGVVTLPASVEQIGLNGFRSAQFSKIVIPDNSHLKDIGAFAFDSFHMTGTLKLPAALETLGSQAFGKAKLTEIHFPNNVQLKEFPYDCFSQMPNLEHVVFEGTAPNFEIIHSRAFDRCEKLKTVDIPEKVKTIEGSAFVTTPSMETVNFKEPSSLTAIGGSAFSKSGLRHIELPSTVTTIEKQAFDNCVNFTDITIPVSVTDIKVGAFNFCEQLQNIKVDEGNNKYASLAGMLTNKTKTELVVFPAGRSSDKYTMIPNIATVAPYAFYASKKLNNITVPKTVTTIGTRAIGLCTNLKSISFMGEDNVPSLTGEIMFNSSNPKDVTIFVRKKWYENPANTSTINTYNTKYKEVHPSFVSKVGYDRGIEFFPTSMTDAGVISFYTPRTSVIIDKNIKEDNNDPARGKTWTGNYNVSSVLDYAYENENHVKDIVFLADIGVIGLNAFKTGSQLKGIYFVGDTPGTLNSVDYEHPDSYPFNANQAIYVKQSKVQTYKDTWQIGGNTLGITHKIPQQTNSGGGTVCFPFDVIYPSDGGIVPYIPIDYSHAYDVSTPFVRAYSVDDNYIPAFVGALIRSKNVASISNYCQMDESQAHTLSTLTSMGYNEGNYRMKGIVEETSISTPTGQTLYTFSKGRGMFVNLKDNTVFPYFKAYLTMSNNISSPAKGFSIMFDDKGITTGINHIETEYDNNDTPYYNLNGMQVNKPLKGIYIKNGKKVIIK